MDKRTPLSKIVIHAVTLEDSGLQGRCNLTKDLFLSYLKERSKRLYRLATSSSQQTSNENEKDDSAQITQEKEITKQNNDKSDTIAVIQLFLVRPPALLASAAITSHTLPSSLTLSHQLSPTNKTASEKKSEEREASRYTGYGWSRPFPWEGGLAGEIPTPPESKNPPSRAYRKLDEILAVIGENPRSGSLVVDLGSAPGGWTYRLANDLVLFFLFFSFPPSHFFLPFL